MYTSPYVTYPLSHTDTSQHSKQKAHYDAQEWKQNSLPPAPPPKSHSEDPD